MTYGAQIVTALSNDVTFSGFMVGGTKEFQYSGKLGLNRLQDATAFDQKTGQLLPTCLVYEQKAVPTREAIDMPTGYMSTVTPIILFLYNNPNKGYDLIESAETAAYKVLHGFRLAGGFQVLWQTTVKNKREAFLEDSGYFMFQVNAYGFRVNS